MGLAVHITALVLIIVAYFVAHVPLTASMSWVSSVAIVGFAVPTLLAVYRAKPHKNVLLVVGLLAVFALGIEATSIVTGFPYSRFTYGDMIGGRVGGLVPWTVPFAWVPLVIGVRARISGCQNPLIAAAGAGVYLMFVDVLLDPAAVILGFWKYTQGSVYYNVPFQNFAGWILTGTMAAWLWKRTFTVNFATNLTATLFLTCIFWSAVCAFKAMWVPALTGMCLVVDVTIWSHLQSIKSVKSAMQTLRP